jgi:presenilin 1
VGIRTAWVPAGNLCAGAHLLLTLSASTNATCSVLVGRAAMYDMLTVFACYLAVVAGLGATLLMLAIAHKALPALPISIALAVSFYFISRFVMEPVILPMTLQLVYF